MPCWGWNWSDDPMTAPVREWFDDAADGFEAVLDALDPAQLDDPGLGDWSVRSLLGHTCRAFVTIESYLAAQAGNPAPATTPLLPSPAAYFTTALALIGDPAEVGGRGVTAGRELGDDPRGAAAAIAARVRTLVAETGDDALVVTPVGPMTLANYLATRAFELTVHSLDLCEALGITPGPELARAAVPAIDLAAAISEPEDAIHVLRAMTGRGGLSGGFTVLG